MCLDGVVVRTIRSVVDTDRGKRARGALVDNSCSLRDGSCSQRATLRRRFASVCCFFFQAEDGIRDIGVTGVQTCALPIFANGCFNLGGGLVAESIRMQATDLGKYLLYTKDKTFVTGAAAADRASSPSESAVWEVAEEGTGFKLTNAGSGQSVSATFAPGSGCADYPEAQVNASGNPYTGATPYGEARGFVDAHLHAMAFEFIGGSIRCGRPWHPYGVTHAMVDCPDHGPGGVGGAAEGVLSYGSPVAPHDTVGWPTFKDWPAYRSLTHEQVYWKGLERSEERRVGKECRSRWSPYH